jgi:hypothetical protein
VDGRFILEINKDRRDLLFMVIKKLFVGDIERAHQRMR